MNVRGRLFRTILPVPGFVKIGVKAEAFGVFDEPLIDRRLDLQGSIIIAGDHWLATDI